MAVGRCMVAVVSALAAIGSAPGAAALDSTLDVEARREPGVHFERYSTFAWPPARDVVSGAAAGAHREYQQWMKAAVEGGLKAKGYTMADPASADLSVDFQIRAQDIDLVDVTDEIGPTGASDQAGELFASTSHGPGAGTFILHVRERAADRLVWIGKVTELITDPSKAHARVMEGIARLLARFPDHSP